MGQITESDADVLKPVGLWELVRYFLRLGSFGFGGLSALLRYLALGNNLPLVI